MMTVFEFRVHESHLNYCQMAQKLRMNPASLSLVMRGHRNLTREQLRRASEVFQCPAKVLLEQVTSHQVMLMVRQKLLQREEMKQ